MNLQELQTAIAQFRSAATQQELEALQEMLVEESELVDERLEEIEAAQEAEAERKAQEEWKRSEEGKEEARHFANAIQLWYRTEEVFVVVNGDRRRPNHWEIWIDLEMCKFTGTQSQVIRHIENIVGTGTPYSPNPNCGAKSWRYRWFEYHQSLWLDEVQLSQAAA